MNKINLLVALVFVFWACNDLAPENTPKPVRVLQAKIVNKLLDQGIYDAWGVTRTNGQFIIRSSSGVVRVADEQGETLFESRKNRVLLYDFFQHKLVEYSVSPNREMKSKIVELPGEEQHLAAIKGRNFTI
ncbi:hypothetical protein [Butyricimonas paravirosa]